MGGLGLELDFESNRILVAREGRLSTSGSRIALFVVQAREEWLIARETADLLSRAQGA